MAFSDRTAQFREVVSKSSLPDTARRKPARPQRRAHDDGERETQTLLSKEYLKEAYNILNHINGLTRMLSSIRRPYLNVDSDTATFSAQPSRNFNLGDLEQAWSGIRRLTNEERDQIDLQAKVILSKCADRVKDMEVLEKKRAELASRDNNIIIRWLPSRLRLDASSAFSTNLAAHHSSITYYLNRRLAQASQNQKEMQEERIKRQTERTRTLGSGAAREAVEINTNTPLVSMDSPLSSGSNSWLSGASSNVASSLAATIGLSATNPSIRPSQSPDGRTQAVHALDDDLDDDDDALEELSSSQIQQFEAENATILRSVQNTLASVQQAESRLLDISALQMELIAHLTRQSELTDQLYEDAIATSATVEKGNVQLKEAKRRAKDGRLYILVFLFGASFALLFLHLY